MKIVINALPFRSGGGLTYLHSLLRSVSHAGPHTVRIFVAPEAAASFAGCDVEVIPVPWASRSVLRRLVWERTGLSWALARWKADLYFSPGGILNVFVPRGCQTAIVLQNMLPFAEEELRRYARRHTRMRLRLLKRAMLRGIARADLTIYLTEHACRTIGRLMPHAAARATVIPHGVMAEFLTATRVLPTPAPMPEPYILYVSSFHYYKAHREVVQAYAHLRRLRPTAERLVFVGDGDPRCVADVKAEIVRHGLEEWVRMIGQVPQAALPPYYQHAKAIIFASRCEMFPFILLESMGAGRPLVVSDYPPMPDLAADAAIYFHPDNPDDLARRLAALLDDPHQLDRWGRRAAERVTHFSWQTTAAATWAQFERLTCEGSFC